MWSTLRSAIFWIAPTLTALPLFVAAVRYFPVYDDGWLALFLKEVGPQTLSESMPDRPLMGYLLRGISVFGNGSPAVYAGLSILLWLTLAWLTGVLWRRVEPSRPSWSAVAACMAIAPVVATTQLCTVLVAIPCLLPAVLAWAAALGLLKALAEPEGRHGFLVATCSIALAAGTLISEYALPVAAALVAIMAPRALRSSDDRAKKRARLLVFIIITISALSYRIYQMISDVGFRPSVAPSVAAETARHGAAKLPFNLLNGVWHNLAGVWGGAIAAVSIEWTSKSTLLAAGYGLIIAASLMLAVKYAGGGSREARPSTSASALIVAVGAGTLPVVLMGRSPALSGFGSRFIIPILPAACVATLSLIVRITREKTSLVTAGLFGLICGNATLMTIHSAAHTHAVALAAGKVLRPWSEKGGLTVAVIDLPGMDYEWTAKSSSTWSAALSRRFWLYDAENGLTLYGARDGCPAVSSIDKTLRGLARHGAVDRLLWVSAADDGRISVEPYCRTASRLAN